MENIIESILRNTKVAAPLVSELTEGNMHKQLSAMLFVSKSLHNQELNESSVNQTLSLYKKVYRIINETNICLPEEELEVERTIKKLKEEITTTSAIDASIPRIKTKQTVEGDEKDVNVK